MAISRLLVLETSVFLGALFAIIVVKLLAGSINVKGLLHGRLATGAQYFSPGKVQMLLFTLGVAWEYVALVLKDVTATKLPDVPSTWLATLGGSQVVYLGGKGYSQFEWRRLIRDLLGGGKRDDDA